MDSFDWDPWSVIINSPLLSDAGKRGHTPCRILIRGDRGPHNQTLQK